MINPDRIVVISAMVGLIAGAYTWFGWELAENAGAAISRAFRRRKEEAAEREQARRQTAEREVKEQLGKR